MNLIEFLNQVPSFSDFSQDEIHLLSLSMSPRDYPEGHVFVKEGKTSDGLYLIIDGEVVVTREREDHGIDILERLLSGEVFGLVSLIDHGVRSATCYSHDQLALNLSTSIFATIEFRTYDIHLLLLCKCLTPET